jgi:hypothetical protein
MAGLIIVCGREGHGPGISAADVRRCAALIVPDNIEPHPPILWEQDGVVAAAVNPGPSTLFSQGSVAVGHLYEPRERWWEPGALPPDGSYALCRVGDGRVELVTDLYASRTLWYAMTADLFLASSSQRALVALLGSFELNDEAVSWLLSDGALPPGAGWDARLRWVPPASRLTLDRTRWSLDEARDPIPISPSPGTEDEQVERLRDAVRDACARLDLPWESWRLALSGGMDSRSIALGLVRAGVRPVTVTWGRAAARRDYKSDAVIAGVVAERLGLQNVYYEVDFTGEPIDRVLGRFVATSESRLDHFDAYIDGLRMWRRLVEWGVEGIVRGDAPSQGFRWYYRSEEQLRVRGVGFLLSDYPPSHPIHRLGLAPQTVPDRLRRRPGESLNAYGGRLFQESASPGMLSPLNDLKGLYMEVANPLLSRDVVRAAHTLRESLRRGRRASKAVHASLDIGVRLADHAAPASRSFYLAHPGLRDELRRGLTAPAAERLFSEEAAATLVAPLDVAPDSSPWDRWRPRVKEVAPQRLSELLKPMPQLTGSGTRLTFRAYLAVRVVDLLAEDATLLGPRAS